MQKSKANSKSRPNPRKGRKSNRRDSWEDRESRDMKHDSKTESSNDPKWYATDPALLRDSASIPFSWPIGQRFEKDPKYFVDGTFNSLDITDVVPGVCAIHILPSFGAGLESDALNVAASAMYTYVRHTNAGHANYDPNDLMLYVLGMTQVYSYINYLERVYAIATLYEQRNRYLPDTLFDAMHIDSDSIKNNLADFRYAINVLINKVSSIAVPATMTLFLRQAMIYAYVYTEGESVKDQLYMFVPSGFYKFSLDSDSAGQLEFVAMRDSGNMYTWSELIQYGESLFNAIWNQEDFGIMSGDILKSYGSNILTLSSLNEVVPFAPVYDPMVLHQMKNCTPVGGAIDYTALNVHQNANKSKLENEIRTTLLSGNNAGRVFYTAASNKLLTLDAVEPSPEMVIEATRLMVGLHANRNVSGSYEIALACGSEIPLYVSYWSKNSAGTSIVLSNYAYSDSVIAGTTMATDIIGPASYVKSFKFAPEYDILTFASGSDTNWTNVTSFREVDNYAVLSNDDVKKMHTSAILNMLNVPSAAKNVRV